MTDFVRAFFQAVLDYQPAALNIIVDPDVAPLNAVWYLGLKIDVAYGVPDAGSNTLLADAALRNIMIHINRNARTVTWKHFKDARFQEVLMPANYAEPQVHPRLMATLHTAKGKAQSHEIVKGILKFASIMVGGPNEDILEGVAVDVITAWGVQVLQHPQLMGFIQEVIDDRLQGVPVNHVGIPEVIFVQGETVFWGFAAAGRIYLNLDSFKEDMTFLQAEESTITDEEMLRILKVSLGVVIIHECTHVVLRQAIGNLNLSTPVITRRNIPESGHYTVKTAFTIPSYANFPNWVGGLTYRVLTNAGYWETLENCFANGNNFPDISDLVGQINTMDVRDHGFSF